MLTLDKLSKEIVINKLIDKKLSNPNKRHEKKTEKLNLDVTLRPSRLDAKSFEVLIISRYYYCLLFIVIFKEYSHFYLYLFEICFLKR